jgi:hypothetical protein
MTGAGKSVIIADTLGTDCTPVLDSLIVEDGLSHALLTQTKGCEPAIINRNGNICYLEAAEGWSTALRHWRSNGFSSGSGITFVG